MEIKQYGTALGHKIMIHLYTLLGYRFASFILHFVALYYVACTPWVKKSLQSYYAHLGLELNYAAYYKHIYMFALSIFDRFVSRIQPDELSFTRDNKEAFYDLKNGGIVLLSHFGGWATAAHSLKADIPPMYIVMQEMSKKNISEVEKSKKRKNESRVRIIDLAQGAIAANVQIANALINNELVAMMADRVTDKSKAVEVLFLGSVVKINRNPFDIAKKFNKTLVVAIAPSIQLKKYNLLFKEIQTDNKTIEEIAQEYMNMLEQMVRKYPSQWYNFYDFFANREQ